MIKKIGLYAAFISAMLFINTANGGISKSVVQVDPGNTKLTGQQFIYRLTYSCDNVNTDCINAQVIDNLPPEVQYVSHTQTSDVDNVSVVGNLITFTMISPLPAGNSGDLLINVRFPNGSTADGTVATNTADGVNLGATPGTVTTPPVAVTAVASASFNLTKTLTSTPANLDLPTTYRLRIANPNTPGGLNINDISVTDTLPAGVVYQGSTPAADCEPACIGTVAPVLVWSGPYSVNVGNNRDFLVTVTYPSATFTDGQNVNNTFEATGTPVGEPPISLGTGSINHPVEVFTPDPDIDLSKFINRPNPPTLNQNFTYGMRLRNVGNVDLENVQIIDTLPIEFTALSATTGLYSNYTGVVNLSYETNLSAGFIALGSSPANTSASFNIPVLGAGEYVTRLRWDYPSPVPPNTDSTTRIFITGQINNPDNIGNPVNIGDSVQNCADVTSVFEPAGANSPTNDLNNCPSFNVSGPFVQLRPIKDETSSGPYLPGDNVTWRLRAFNNSISSTSMALEQLVITDLLPVDLIYVPASWTYNDQGTGLPAPNFSQVDNYNNTERTLLSWTWPAGSGNLGIGQEVRISHQTTVRQGASFGDLTNTMGMTHNDPGLGLRCGNNNNGTQGRVNDDFDQDQDGNTADRLCTESATATISAVAQLSSSKEVRAVCDADFTDSSAGALLGTPFQYQLTVENQGTLTTEEFVFIDILPAIGDTGVLDTNNRDSLWEPVLLAPITPPPGTVIYYSTSSNPCRPEVGGITTGCDAPNWSTVIPDPISDTKSFKVEFADKDVNSFDTLQFELTMFAPTDAPTNGDEAFNSFAYRGFRADGLGALSAEPNKVGISIGSCPVLASLGDYVWVDENINGIQDDGNTGVNGVYAQLYDDGADGIPNTADDTLVSTTITSDDVNGIPGWYQFVTLPEDTYYVCFEPPSNYTITDQDVGGNDAIDSDVNPNTLCTNPVFLPADTNNPDLDLGLIGPFAALGNYVWWDLNNDGVQNEPVDFGVNGVTVNLYADNGDGTADPANDQLLSSLVTTDDLFGNPGYYEFGELIPGVPYFVEFIEPSPATGFTVQNAGGDDVVDSDANSSTGLTPVVTLGNGEINPTIDAGLIVLSGNLSLGNQVWFENESGAVGINNGLFEPQLGEPGIDRVNLDLYLDVNGSGSADLNEYITTTQTAVSNGFDGRYLFENLAPGDYIVTVTADNFAGNGALSGLATCTANDPVTDPDDNLNGDDDGTQLGGIVSALAITLSNGDEPITDGDANNDSNLTVDFCFTPVDPANVLYFDYGDAPDIGPGTANQNYQTTAFDTGAIHQVSDPLNSPYLGSCVDADSGLNHDPAAAADDSNNSTFTRGTCVAGGNDEDGVTFSSDTVLPGDNLDITLTVGAGVPSCSVNAWVDWNQNGVFEDAEIIADQNFVASGSAVVISQVVPAVTPGPIYSRFRCNDIAIPALTQTAVGPNLLIETAPLGEVEDYVIQAVGQDLGDASSSYDTLLIDNGPSHLVNPNEPFYLGSCVDTEDDGAPSLTANGDDTAAGDVTVGFCFDDEDGVVFNASPVNALTVCSMNQVTVEANRAGLLNAWLDFDGNGSFDPSDQIFTDQALTLGINQLNFMLPCNAQLGDSQSRFRLNSVGGLAATGAAADGEIEDHSVVINGIDLGDAPTIYPVTIADDGGRHGVDPLNPLFLGSCVDTENDGQESVDATGDDANVGTVVVGSCQADDDEDGVVFTSPIATCLTSDLTVTNNAAGILDAWFDFNNNGSWLDAGEKIFDGVALAAGANALQFNTPCDANVGTANLRFRFSTTGSVAPTGAATDGEVEDYQVTVNALDMADNPNSYSTQLVDNGPVHLITATANLYLGSCVDSELDGQPTLSADGDDLNAGSVVAGTCTGADDEDGVIFDTGLTVCETENLTVTASAAGILNGFIDFNADGNFGVGEQVFTDQAVTAGANALTVNVPCSATPGDIYSRFRISSAGGDGTTGIAVDGEVEDYVITKGASADLAISKTDDVDPVAAGANLTYTITVNNLGPNAASNVMVNDVLPAGVTLLSTAGCAEDPVAIPNCSLGNIGANASAQYTVTVAVDNDLVNGTQLLNSASVTSDTNDTNPNNNDTTEPTDVIRVSDLSISKVDSVDPATAGEPLTYTITVENLGPSLAENVTVTETLPADVTFDSTSGCAEDPSGVPTCSLGNLGVGDSISYQVLVDVNPGFEGILSNTAVVTSDSSDNNVNNNDDTEPTVVGAAADLQITKVDDVDPAPPGTALNYTLSVFNAGPSDAVNVVINDVLPSEVTFVSTTGCNEDPNGMPNCSLGDVLVSQTVNVQVAVTVNSDAVGEIVNTASVTSDTPDQDTTNNTDTEPTTVESADLSITKIDDVDPVRAGENLTYTIRVDNAGPSAAADVVVTDTLPPEVSFVASSGCIEDPAANPNCSLGTIAAGGFAEYQVVVLVDSDLAEGSTFTNAASVSTSTTDPELDNNDTTEITQVVTEADISIEKVVLNINGNPVMNDNNPLQPNDTMRYQITVNNAGPSTAINVVASDILPQALDFVATTGCAEDPNGVPACSLGDLAAGDSISYFIDVTINNQVDGSINNSADVTSDTTDPDPNNNSENNQIGGRVRQIPVDNPWFLLFMASILMWFGMKQVRNKP